MKIKIQWEFDLPTTVDYYDEEHDKFAFDNGIPLEVNLSDYFEDPENTDEFQITDALSDEYGWLVNNWEVINEACNLDKDIDIINHQAQTINPLEDQMDNLTISAPSSNEEISMADNDSGFTVDNLNNNEEVMSQQDMIVSMFKSFLAEGGDPKVTAFKMHLNTLINDNVKALCHRSGKAADGSDWRSKLKARFSGKGAKWVIVALSEINPTIAQLESEGVDCDDYKTLIEMQGGAWIRYSGARVSEDGKQSAAFEVRTGGSTSDHPKQLHLIPVELLDETIRSMGGTPRSLKFEVVVKDEVSAAGDEIDVLVSEEVVDDSEVVLDRLDPENLQNVYEDFVSVDDDLNDDIF
jgi:hypothetical protein